MSATIPTQPSILEITRDTNNKKLGYSSVQADANTLTFKQLVSSIPIFASFSFSLHSAPATPVITAQVSSVVANPGKHVAFSVVVTTAAVAPLSYQNGSATASPSMEQIPRS